MTRKMMVAVALVAAAVAAYAGMPRKADLRAFDAAEMALLETAMWRDYYEKRYPALFYHLYESSRRQFGFSPLDSARIALSAAQAARAFQPTRSRDEADVARPYLVTYYGLLRPAAPSAFDINEAARRELDWWQARREKSARATMAGRRRRCRADLWQAAGSARSIVAFGISRAEAMAYRDARGEAITDADWSDDRDAIARRLLDGCAPGSAVRAPADKRAGKQPTKKPRQDAGAFKFLTQGGDQYLATTGPVQLKR